MKQFERIKLQHANLNREVFIVLGTIAGFHYSESNKCTHVYTTGGVFPAVETPEQIGKIIDTLTQTTNKEVRNGV